MDQTTPTTGVEAAGSDTLRQTDEQRAASRALSLQSLETPGVSPGYEIIRKLGTGSFGAVWLAREVKTGKQVAIKFYTHRRGLDWSLLTREVEKLAVLYTSRDIVGLLDVGWEHDPPYFVMEFLEHGSLYGRLQAGRLPIETSVRIATSVARALVHAHGSGILHCDLKPANILLDKADEPRLGDFGQSRLTTEQSPALGTMYYMAPEQADLNAVPDARWDVYALGALLYEMLTGSPPYRTDEAEQKLGRANGLEERLATYRQIISRSPPPAAHKNLKGIDKPLVEIVDNCLKPNPQERFPNAQVVLDRLEQRTAARSRRPLVAVGFLGPILFILAMFWIAWFYGKKAVTAAEKNLVERALAGDSVSALILADSIERDLATRLERVHAVARTEEAKAVARVLLDQPPEPSATETDKIPLPMRLLDLIEGRSQDPVAQKSFSELAADIRANEARLGAERRTEDTGWFIQDARGTQVFRYPARDPMNEPYISIGRDYHWRRYFAGLDDDLPEDTPFSKVKIRHDDGSVSTAFRSHATNQYMIAIAAPIWDAEHDAWVRNGKQGPPRGEVIGVIASTIHIADLLEQWEHTIHEPGAEDDNNVRFLALAAYDKTRSEAKLLDHPWMTPDNLKGIVGAGTPKAQSEALDAFMRRLRLSDRATQNIEKLMHSQRDYREDRYADPFVQQSQGFAGEWLAAFAPVAETNWVAIVQERRATAIEPVQNVEAIFYRAGAIAILVFGVLLAVLWYFLNRASSQQ
jgi:eukaryotic-like serine/threonine-protein kinase